jgi:hypothetical protein
MSTWSIPWRPLLNDGSEHILHGQTKTLCLLSLDSEALTDLLQGHYSRDPWAFFVGTGGFMTYTDYLDAKTTADVLGASFEVRCRAFRNWPSSSRDFVVKIGVQQTAGSFVPSGAIDTID